MPATRKRSEPNEDTLKQLQGIFTSNPVIEPEIDEEEKYAEPVIETVKVTKEVTKPVASALNDKIHELDPSSNVITEEKKEVSDTTVGIRMPTAKKREMKAYFIQHGTTMSQGVIDAFALLKVLEEEGKVEYKDGILERV